MNSFPLVVGYVLLALLLAGSLALLYVGATVRRIRRTVERGLRRWDGEP